MREFVNKISFRPQLPKKPKACLEGRSCRIFLRQKRHLVEKMKKLTSWKLAVRTLKITVFCRKGKLGGGFKDFFYFHLYLGKTPILTNVFQMGWFNHQLEYLPNLHFEVSTDRFFSGVVSWMISGSVEGGFKDAMREETIWRKWQRCVYTFVQNKHKTWCLLNICWLKQPHRIHGTGIFTYIWLKFKCR